MKSALVTLLMSLYLISNSFGQETIGSQSTQVRTQNNIQYSVIRSDINGNIIWTEDLINNQLFDSTLDIYSIYGYTTLKNNKISSNPNDYDYWLIIKTKTIDSFIYPNPTKNNVFIFTNDLDNNIRIVLYDINGKIVLQQKLIDYTTNIKLTGLNSGVYLYNIENNFSIIKTGKLCIN